ncbi:hypothetical protein F9C07_1633723 [Aspergillus flavus]|uniref:Uncharacterized protein n=1 Tax=Aspergillus flavus (strain ATCC 200026 / FGSC A1120 / IAM 13836 / NRRL 3357 / JCM 12722 / SRRC 167) TaxID=332952 RepID=A0A7U2QT09_ASPFN|nr:hypothetical protein F9C07_1633723 [Aspergillus flavus]
MEPTASKTEGSVPNPMRPEPPVRILVQTLTHLVPDNGNFERTDFILNRICQHHWNCDLRVPKFHWASYNNKFALNNRLCFLLVDYGPNLKMMTVCLYCPMSGQDNLCKEITTTVSKRPKIQAKLKEDVPFTY